MKLRTWLTTAGVVLAVGVVEGAVRVEGGTRVAQKGPQLWVAGALVALFALVFVFLFRSVRSELEEDLATPFDRVRTWRRFQLATAIGLAVIGAAGLIGLVLELAFSPLLNLLVCLPSLMIGVFAQLAYNSARCPYCGKHVMSYWSGRDGRKRKAVERIMHRETVVCVHCGAEVETAECNGAS